MTESIQPTENNLSIENIAIPSWGIPAEDYKRLSRLDLSAYARVKKNLTYIPWGVSMQILKTYNPELGVTLVKGNEGKLYHGNPDIGYYVMVYLTRNGERISEDLIHAIRDFKMQPSMNPKITDITNSSQRAIAKCIAIYAGIGMTLYSQIDESIDFIQDDGSIITDETFKLWKSPEDAIKWAVSEGVPEDEATKLIQTVPPDSRGKRSKPFFYAVKAMKTK